MTVAEAATILKGPMGRAIAALGKPTDVFATSSDYTAQKIADLVLRAKVEKVGTGGFIGYKILVEDEVLITETVLSTDDVKELTDLLDTITDHPQVDGNLRETLEEIIEPFWGDEKKKRLGEVLDKLGIKRATSSLNRKV